jgi:aminoglycoside phosphotransferase (APT) family kinase protein
VNGEKAWMRIVFDPTPDQKILLDGIELLRGAHILEKLAGGPASDSWLLTAGDEQFVARLDKPLARLLGLDRRAELEVLHTVSVAGIGPQIIWSDPDKGVLVTSWIPGNAWSAVDVHDPVKLGALAATLRQLHSLPPRGPVFAPGAIALAYAREAGTNSATRIAEQAAKLAEKLLSETGRPALCHNDLVHSNIIGGETVRLIDWEYSAVGDPYFDLATVVQHHQLKADRVEIFLGAYFGTAGKEHFSRLEAFCRLYDQLAALWYLSVKNQPGHDALYDEELNRIMARL